MTLAESTGAVLHSLENGRIDAAILRADVIAYAQRRGILNATVFKYVDAVSKFDRHCLTWRHSAQRCAAPDAQVLGAAQQARTTEIKPGCSSGSSSAARYVQGSGTA